MGKLGGREMNAASDLDLIVVYEFDPEYPESDGRRPMAAQPYFARLTQRLINALTAPTNLGRLYDVDLRLRPSGRSGPVATSIAAFESYQRDEAWTWEHLALTRARVVSGPPALAARIERVVRSVLCARRDAVAVAADVRDMRRAIATERGEADRWNLKDAAGGLIDLEFVAQYLQLAHAAKHPDILSPSTALALEKATRFGLLARDDADVMRTAVRCYHDLTQILRLCVVGPFDPDKAGPGLLQLLAGVGDAPDFPALDAKLKQTLAAVRAAAERVLAQAG
jgi:glutamate-ammonia-ligase adenylyltransferase